MVLGSGLNPVCTPSAGRRAEVNVVFVHGLFGGPQSTWSTVITSKKRKELVHAAADDQARGATNAPIPEVGEEVFWPEVLLPRVIPGANVFSFGFDADVENFMRSVGLNSIHANGRSLLVALGDLLESQQRPGVEGKPFLFIAHSLGGLVVKEALNQSAGSSTERLAKVVRRTLGVIFLGTPHRGASIATLGRKAFRLSEVLVGQKANVSLMRALERNSDTLARLTTGFVETIRRYPSLQTYCFCEDRETRALVFGQRIVQPDSAKLDSPDFDYIPANHRDMAKFVSVRDVGFLMITSVMNRWIRDLPDFHPRVEAARAAPQTPAQMVEHKTPLREPSEEATQLAVVYLGTGQLAAPGSAEAGLEAV
ncbi:hypothetical protein F4780DRAFT_776814 [Xylariomycetidae sp. FL0641]|nr:hypothetical protein F4780DRAFT_776814 [Xylariomycetidae sp. FL0641]